MVARTTSPERVSVVIPTRNRLRTLRQALDSVFVQQGVIVDTIVVDEASTDGTLRELESLSRNVTVVRHKAPRGLPAARNSGLKVVTNKWVAFLDDDDIWAPDKLRQQLDAMIELPGAQWSIVGHVGVTEDLEPRWEEKRPPPGGDISRLILTRNVVPGGGSGVLAATALMRKVGGFHETLRAAEDWDMWIRLAQLSPVASVDRPLVAKRSATNSAGSSSWFRSTAAWYDALDTMGERYGTITGGRAFEAEIRMKIAHLLLRDGAGLKASGEYYRAWRAGYSGRALVLATACRLMPGLAGRKKEARHIRERGWRSSWSASAEDWITPYRATAAPERPL